MIIIYGPYEREDGRKHIILYDNITKRKTTMSYSKYLLQQKLDRALIGDETTDHIDEDFTNDNQENLQVLSRSDNSRKSRKPPEMIDLVCEVCNKQFQRLARQHRHNKRKSMHICCSKQCAGKIK